MNSPVLRKTNNFYLPLDRYDDFLNKWIKDKSFKINVYGQVKSWINNGLHPRSITRDLDWGINLPIREYENKVMYVWFEAPIGYISSTIEWAIKNNQNWEKYWKKYDTKLINFIGKDNIVFHCIIFPVILNMYGSYVLPYNVYSNEFLNLENKKISTSRKWAVWLHEYLDDFKNQEDALRYSLIMNMPENRDTNFSWKEFQIHTNSELVGILGNFINRVLVLTHKYCGGIAPFPGCILCIDIKYLKTIHSILNKIDLLMNTYKFRDALNEFIKIPRLGNKYLTDERPWKEKDHYRKNTIINISLQIAGIINHLSYIFLPRTYEKLKNMFSTNVCLCYNLENLTLFTPGHILNKNFFLLFNRIEDDMIEKQINKLK
jgi:methionyl-tRNA synthetase